METAKEWTRLRPCERFPKPSSGRQRQASRVISRANWKWTNADSHRISVRTRRTVPIAMLSVRGSFDGSDRLQDGSRLKTRMRDMAPLSRNKRKGRRRQDPSPKKERYHDGTAGSGEQRAGRRGQASNKQIRTCERSTDGWIDGLGLPLCQRQVRGNCAAELCSGV